MSEDDTMWLVIHYDYERADWVVDYISDRLDGAQSFMGEVEETSGGEIDFYFGRVRLQEKKT